MGTLSYYRGAILRELITAQSGTCMPLGFATRVNAPTQQETPALHFYETTREPDLNPPAEQRRSLISTAAPSSTAYVHVRSRYLNPGIWGLTQTVVPQQIAWLHWPECTVRNGMTALVRTWRPLCTSTRCAGRELYILFIPFILLTTGSDN